MRKHLDKIELKDKIIDAHSHIGVFIKAYALAEYPYAQTAENIYYHQLTGNVDVNIVFPLSADLYFDFDKLLSGQLIPSKSSASRVPYEKENLILMKEIFEYCPELAKRFIPFISIDPARDVKSQMSAIEHLNEKYPIYGIKVNPVGCQSHAKKILTEGHIFLEFAQDNNIPFIFHSVSAPVDEYSQASDIIEIAEKNPEIRFCLAHTLHFNKALLERANKLPNVWTDTAAFKIQIDLAMQFVREDIIKRSDLFDTDYSEPSIVIKDILEEFPNLIIWGTDIPAYTFHCKRKQGENIYQEFNLKGTYKDEIKVLKSLPNDLQMKIANKNTLEFLFG